MHTGDLSFAVVEITNLCNLRCPHCASDSGTRRDGELTTPEWFGVFADLRDLGCRRLTLLGGEFLLHPDWFELGRRVRENGIELQLITNGVRVDPAAVEQFSALTPQAVAVSLDGATRESYRAMRGVDGFDQCLKVLEMLSAHPGIRQTTAITTFSSRNLADFDRFAALFLDRPIAWQVQMVNRGGDRFDDSLLLSPEQYDFFVRKVADAKSRWGGRLQLGVTDDFGYFPLVENFDFLPRWGGCPAGERVIGIRANGDILPCLSLGSAFIGGNLRTRPLPELWRDDRTFADFRRKETLLRGVCAACPHGPVCKAGCSTMAVSSTGAPGENLYCIRAREQEKILRDFL